MLVVQDLSYLHPNKDLLFKDLNLAMGAGEQVALVGNNGAGKSTLLRIIAGQLLPAGGTIRADSIPYYVPQLFGQYNQMSIAEALGVDMKLQALHRILEGNVAEENYDRLQEDWAIEERSREALSGWGLENLDLSQKLGTLSGGQKTKVFLAGIRIHKPGLILMDEPTNHLDRNGREKLYEWVKKDRSTLLVVSHDRELLNLLRRIWELDGSGITVYGGSYDFYAAQRAIEAQTLEQNIQHQEKELRKAKEKERESIERQQKLDARAKKGVGNAGLPRIVANTLKNKAENSGSRIKGVHAEKVGHIISNLHDLRMSRSAADQMKFGFDDSGLHKGKTLFVAEHVNICYGKEDRGNRKFLWPGNLDLQILSGERMAVTGPNGSGKTTLIRLILGELEPDTGTVRRAPGSAVYIDQDYSLIDPELNVYEQAAQYNITGMQEHEVKTRLDRFLFAGEDWDKPCFVLSGGERMRLVLCCLSIGHNAPDLMILDEPTNNLDMQNIAILTNAIRDYRGTLLVVSHDRTFLDEIGIERNIRLESGRSHI